MWTSISHFLKNYIYRRRKYIRTLGGIAYLLANQVQSHKMPNSKITYEFVDHKHVMTQKRE